MLQCNFTLKKGGRVAELNMAENHTLVKVIALKNLIQRNRQRRKLLLASIASAIQRRRRLVKLCMTALLLMFNVFRNKPVLRSCQHLQRNGGWWNVVWNTYTDARFKKTLRVNRCTFLYILETIRHAIERETVTEVPVSPEQRLVLCLYRLG